MASLKVLHLADVHIGMKFSAYPETIRRELIDARTSALEKAVRFADDSKYDWIIISGDLFENLKVSKSDIEKVYEILDGFTGDRVLILPGNHDYYDETVTLWKTLMGFKSDKTVILSECKRYDFEVNSLSIAVYAAPCSSKHSKTNNLGWIRDEILRDTNVNILVAHGALKELSPDMAGSYYPMTIQEITDLRMDLNLLGHTHVPYPLLDSTTDTRLFNSGTPEPDGLNYRYEGSCWGIEIDGNKSVKAEKIYTGQYRFFDKNITVEDTLENEPYEIFAPLLTTFSEFDLKKLIVRIYLDGFINKDSYHNRHSYLNSLQNQFAYLELDDNSLKAKFDENSISEIFTEGSLPHVFLNQLLNSYDEETAHLAFELMGEVLKRD